MEDPGHHFPTEKDAKVEALSIRNGKMTKCPLYIKYLSSNMKPAAQ